MKPHYYVANLETFTLGEKHKTLAEATTEAERLAEKHPGTAFEILQCLGVSSVPKASTFWMDGVDPKSEPINALDAEIQRTWEKYQGFFRLYENLKPEERNGSFEAAEANYWKGRRDALEALKNLGK